MYPQSCGTLGSQGLGSGGWAGCRLSNWGCLAINERLPYSCRRLCPWWCRLADCSITSVFCADWHCAGCVCCSALPGATDRRCRLRCPAQPEAAGAAPEGFDKVSLTTEDGIALGAWDRAPTNGAAILLLHGAGDSLESMRPYAAFLIRFQSDTTLGPGRRRNDASCWHRSSTITKTSRQKSSKSCIIRRDPWVPGVSRLRNLPIPHPRSLSRVLSSNWA